MAKKKVKTAAAATAQNGGPGEVSLQTTRRTIRGRRGSLKDMPEMPMDILQEILVYLEPLDLLHLARTSKGFRALLLSRTSAYLWKAARQNVDGLPDCPPHLCEPAYANLAFSNHCHGCLKTSNSAVLWEFAVRYCSECKRNRLLRLYYIHLPYSLDSIQAELLNHVEVPSRGLRCMYHVHQAEEFMRAWGQLPDDIAQKRFVDEQRQRVKQVQEHAALCRAWAETRVHSRATELEQMREDRLQAVLLRLRGIGWEEELTHLAPQQYYPLTEHAHLKSPKKLTDRVWEKISGDLVELMQKIKDDRLLQDRKKLMGRRLASVASMVNDCYAENRRTRETESKPQLVDFTKMPEVRDFVTADELGSLELERELALCARLPVLIERWQAKRAIELTSLLKKHIPVAQEVDVLQLAIAYFYCRSCRRLLSFPDVLAHGCFHPRLYYTSTSGTTTADLYRNAVEEATRTQAWSSSKLYFAGGGFYAQIRKVIELCGKDPEKTTREEILSLDPGFIYSEGTKNEGMRTWRQVVHLEWRRYQLSCLSYSGDIRLASETEKEEAKLKHTSQSFPSPLQNRSEWCCSRCTYRTKAFETIADIRKHMQVMHSIADLSIDNGDAYLHPDADEYAI